MRDLWLRNGNVRERISNNGRIEGEIYDLLPVLALCPATPYSATDINATLCSRGRGQWDIRPVSPWDHLLTREEIPGNRDALVRTNTASDFSSERISRDNSGRLSWKYDVAESRTLIAVINVTALKREGRRKGGRERKRDAPDDSPRVLR